MVSHCGAMGSSPMANGWGGGDPPAVVFTCAPGRHGHPAMDILTGFEGLLQVDGYTGQDALAEPKRVGGMPPPRRWLDAGLLPGPFPAQAA